MRPLSSRDILEVWELGQDRRPLDRALLLLSAGLRERSQGELLALSIGQRDALLLSLCEATIGPELTGFAECSACGERLELPLAIRDLRVDAGDAAAEYVLAAEAPDGVEVCFRLPNTLDVAAAVQAGDARAARLLVAQRCVIAARQGGAPIAPQELSAELLGRLSERMSECDPQADILLNLACPACGQKRQMLFDIVSFLWSEVAARAKRLLGEVDALARAYGWSEGEILRLSPARRRLYVEMVGGWQTS